EQPGGPGDPRFGSALVASLPRAEPEAGGPKPLPQPQAPARGSETILLAEDEDVVRALSRMVLQSAGYTVLEARDGEEALQLARQHAGPIHLLVTDVVMPGLGGRELADRLAALRPGLRVLYLSGYTDDAVVRYGVSHDQVHFLEKPFSPKGLAEKVREVLDSPEAGPR